MSLITSNAERAQEKKKKLKAVVNMATTPFLRNKYWVLRHGKSIPNEKGVIVSSLVRLSTLFNQITC